MAEPGPTTPSAPPAGGPGADPEAAGARPRPEGDLRSRRNPQRTTHAALPSARSTPPRTDGGAPPPTWTTCASSTRGVARARENERELVTAAFLPVLDTIDRAGTRRGGPGSIVEGIRTLREQALAVVSGLGYGREDEPGVPFDPARHEVVGVVDADGAGTPPGSVASVLRPGYGAPGRQLRPAAVTVAQRRG